MLSLTTRRQLQANGLKISKAYSQQLKALQEGLGAIRDVLIEGSQPFYLEIYRQADRPQRQLQAKNDFLTSFPRYALEALGMVSIALFGWLLVMQRGNGAAAIPLLGALALGAQRLFPALQQIYSGWAVIKGYNASIQGVLMMLSQPLPLQLHEAEPWQLRQGIRLDGVHFHYPAQKSDVLHGLHMEIRKGDRIGLIGSTGSGKSTTVDIIMGLLEPTHGQVLVDEMNLYDSAYPDRLVSWRAAIAHVPQSIYLADGSIAENIAFGKPHHLIDMARVKKAAKMAQIDRFIESIPESYDSFVGERGIRLSGGQRQRIGIARALYKQAQVLILDEATSALDSETENEVMNSIHNLTRKLTIIMIAHRLSTLQGCDKIIQLNRGRIG